MDLYFGIGVLACYHVLDRNLNVQVLPDLGANFPLQHELFRFELLVVIPADEVIEHLLEGLSVDTFVKALLVLIFTVYLSLGHVDMLEKPVDIGKVVGGEDEGPGYHKEYGKTESIRFAFGSNALRIVDHEGKLMEEYLHIGNWKNH